MGGHGHLADTAGQAIDHRQEPLVRVQAGLVGTGPLPLDHPHPKTSLRRPIGIPRAAGPAARHRQAQARVVGPQGLQSRECGIRRFRAVAVEVQTLPVRGGLLRQALQGARFVAQGRHLQRAIAPSAGVRRGGCRQRIRRFQSRQRGDGLAADTLHLRGGLLAGIEVPEGEAAACGGTLAGPLHGILQARPRHVGAAGPLQQGFSKRVSPALQRLVPERLHAGAAVGSGAADRACQRAHSAREASAKSARAPGHEAG